MTEPSAGERTPGRRRATRRPAPAAVLAAVLAVVLVGTGPAAAYWTATGSGSGAAVTGTLAPPVDVTVPANATRDVLVSWTPATSGVPPTGYYVTRSSEGTPTAACASSATALIATTSCTDTSVPDGSYTYEVTAVHTSWTALSAPSQVVTVVNATTLAFTVQPTDTVVNEPITPAVTVALKTAGGAAVASAGIPVTLTVATNPAGGTLSGTTVVETDETGAATFDGLSLDEAGTGYTLRATSPGLTTATSATFAVTAPPLLGAAQGYSVLAGTAVVSTGTTTVSGDLGVSPGTSVTGFPPGTVGGDIHAGDPDAAAAQSALVDAYTELAARPPDREVIGDLGGLTFRKGVYHSTAALALTGTLTLDAEGDPNAVFIFQTDAAFNTAAASTVTLTNGAQPANVFWVVTGAAGTGANSFLSGSILAQGAITLGASTTLIGQALSRATVTLAGNMIRFTDAMPPTVTIDGGAGAVTKDTTPTITGTSSAAASSPVTVTVAGQTLLTTIGSAGTWTVTAAALTAGVHDIVAKVRDAAGNGGTATQTLTVEVNPPTVVLGAARTYSVLAGTNVVSTGTTTVSGDLGVSPGTSVTGFPPGVVGGNIHAGDTEAADAQTDLLTALNDASSRPPHRELIGDLGGLTFHEGVYHSTAALALTGTLTLDAEGDPNAVFIFQTDAAFNTAAASTVTLTNGAQPANVFWVVTGAAGTGANSFLSGSILAQGAITLGASTTLIGQALSRATVTLAGNTLTGITPAPATARTAPVLVPRATNLTGR
ncbi:ice-binding family protein [Amycolatopsis sp. NPDC051128]|uniref:ice-binding family protein n=1 Tax=Amycolatopsis sp. NPDC051128 TaxID=3155412 RepID=UPI0034324B34